MQSHSLNIQNNLQALQLGTTSAADKILRNFKKKMAIKIEKIRK